MLIHRERLKDLVLVGGGHSHVVAVKKFGMQPFLGHQVSLISPHTEVTYSGMLPGLIAGHYQPHESQIDLMHLCQWAGVRFIKAEVIGFDPFQRLLRVSDRPDISYDVVSFNVGAEPDLSVISDPLGAAVSVKPITGFWKKWCALKDRLAGPARIALVGGGAGSVELVLAMAESLSGENHRFDLYCGASEILSDYNASIRRVARRELKRYRIAVHCNAWVDRINRHSLLVNSEIKHDYDEVFLCTSAAPTHWLMNSGLSLDQNGFVAIQDTLQAIGFDNVFASGDCATQLNYPRPKAGVFAVRQAAVLAHNLRAKLTDGRMKLHRPQETFLSILSLGRKSAVAAFGQIFFSGSWAWRWKNAIDVKFIDQFRGLETSDMNPADVARSSKSGSIPLQPHCGGCGAKVAANVLSDVLNALSLDYPEHCRIIEDDASRLNLPGSFAWQTIDALREIVSDPYQMGQLTANHALSDLYACGLTPKSAMALVVLPFASPSIQSRELKQILSGALSIFRQADCCLIGGHSMQGPEIQIAFVINGVLPNEKAQPLRKKGLSNSDILILTRPLGSGVLFAAHMQLKARGAELDDALNFMCKSNASAASVSRVAGVSAVTDVTGFGLIGHLREMLSTKQGAVIDVNALPVYNGALACLDRGVRSTMHSNNLKAMEPFLRGLDRASVKAQLIFDPQTCGGLLIGVNPSRIDSFFKAVDAAGENAQVIGRVKESSAQVIELC